MCDYCIAPAQYRFDGKGGSLFFCLHHTRALQNSLVSNGFLGMLIGNLELV